MLHSAFLLENFVDFMEKGKNSRMFPEQESKVIEETIKYVRNDLIPHLNSSTSTWRDFLSFWPPRYVEAAKTDEAIAFFGAGLSQSCGVPTWHQLLSEGFKLDITLTEDKDLQQDPLTLAELAAQYLGSETLQELLFNTMNEARKFSINHAALAALRFPVYITTNYDCLFENAWREINPTIELVVVTNDSWMITPEYTNASANKASILYKIHGSSERRREHLILTRRDYRFHYRANHGLFSKIRELLKTKHTLFLGFSHKDPEVSRLVEDAIYEFETSKKHPVPTGPRPQFYSLQFDMRAHTPEVFAARGIVALTPPVLPTSFENVKTQSLAISLCDLIGAKKSDLHSKVSLDGLLRDSMHKIVDDINSRLRIMDTYRPRAEETLNNGKSPTWLNDLCAALGDLASQGVYLLDDQGTVVAFEVPAGLEKSARVPKKSFQDRPYFKLATSFRQPFVSDSAASVYQGQSTVFLCVPILKNERMMGLLFSATQIGQWKTPIKIAEAYWDKGYSFLLIDSNGVCLLPPKRELKLEDCSVAGTMEGKDKNLGYSWEELLELSRRDMLVRHISKSVVPVTQDDDVLTLAADLREFTIVSEIPRSRWKIGVALPIRTR